MRKPIFEPNKSYDFSDYFYLSGTTKQIVAEFGYQFSMETLRLPVASLENVSLDRLKQSYIKKNPLVSLDNETARREFFVSPLFLELLDYVETEIAIEHQLDYDEKLKGKIDYLLRAQNKFVVVEAKFADMEHGFTQLAVEMIAVDKYYEDEKTDFIYGAVTVGDVWRFGILNRESKIVYKDIVVYSLPTQLEELFAILLGILQNKN